MTGYVYRSISNTPILADDDSTQTNKDCCHFYCLLFFSILVHKGNKKKEKNWCALRTFMKPWRGRTKEWERKQQNERDRKCSNIEQKKITTYAFKPQRSQNNNCCCCWHCWLLFCWFYRKRKYLFLFSSFSVSLRSLFFCFHSVDFNHLFFLSLLQYHRHVLICRVQPCMRLMMPMREKNEEYRRTDVYERMNGREEIKRNNVILCVIYSFLSLSHFSFIQHYLMSHSGH